MVKDEWRNTVGTVLMDLPDSMTIEQFRAVQDMIAYVTKEQGGYQQSWSGPTFMLFHMTQEESDRLKGLLVEFFGADKVNGWDYCYDDDFPENDYEPITQVFYTDASGDVKVMVSKARMKDYLESEWFEHCIKEGIIDSISSNVVEEFR